MNYDKYYKARSIVTEILEKDLLGPLSEDEIITDYPVVYYITGKLSLENKKQKIAKKHYDISSI